MVRAPFHPILRRAHEFRLLSEQRFDDHLRVLERKADADGHHQRHVFQPPAPGARIQLALRHQVKRRDRAGGREEQGQVQVEHLEPALIEAHDNGGQQDDGE